ncbi:MAG: hypothetical protein RLY57_682 [Candidatus Parcubacteria bacterium]|jgi:hypothetical protein
MCNFILSVFLAFIGFIVVVWSIFELITSPEPGISFGPGTGILIGSGFIAVSCGFSLIQIKKGS